MASFSLSALVSEYKVNPVMDGWRWGVFLGGLAFSGFVVQIVDMLEIRAEMFGAVGSAILGAPFLWGAATTIEGDLAKRFGLQPEEDANGRTFLVIGAIVLLTPWRKPLMCVATIVLLVLTFSILLGRFRDRISDSRASSI